MAEVDLIEAILKEPAPPCDDCVMRRICGRQKFACESFHVYVNEGPRYKEGKTKVKKWIGKSKEPSRKLYNKIFFGNIAGVVK